MLMKNIVMLETRLDEHDCQLNISNGCPAYFVLNSLEKFKLHVSSLIEKDKPEEKNTDEIKEVQ